MKKKKNNKLYVEFTTEDWNTKTKELEHWYKWYRPLTFLYKAWAPKRERNESDEEYRARLEPIAWQLYKRRAQLNLQFNMDMAMGVLEMEKIEAEAKAKWKKPGMSDFIKVSI